MDPPFRAPLTQPGSSEGKESITMGESLFSPLPHNGMREGGGRGCPRKREPLFFGMPL